MNSDNILMIIVVLNLLIPDMNSNNALIAIITQKSFILAVKFNKNHSLPP